MADRRYHPLAYAFGQKLAKLAFAPQAGFNTAMGATPPGQSAPLASMGRNSAAGKGGFNNRESPLGKKLPSIKPLAEPRDTQGTFLDNLSNTAFSGSENKLNMGSQLAMPSV